MARILLADDDEMVREAVLRLLQLQDHEVVAVAGGRQVLELVDESFDVIILDINMPDMDGFQTLEALNARDLGIPVLFLTGVGTMEHAVRAINLGAYDFLTKPIEDLEIFQAKIDRAVEKRHYVLKERDYTLRLQTEVEEKTRQLAEKNALLEEYGRQIENATVEIMASLQNAMEAKDIYTAGHTVRVTEYALCLGQALGLDDEDLLVLRRAAQFHDVGKLVIDLSAIQKAGKLTPEEWDLMKRHPEIGAGIIEPLGFMHREREIIRHHHERLDGKGYPDGIGGDEITPLCRIITIVDSFDAMTSRRNYRRNLSCTEAVDELRANAGTQFDPDMVDVFIGLARGNQLPFQQMRADGGCRKMLADGNGVMAATSTV